MDRAGVPAVQVDLPHVPAVVGCAPVTNAINVSPGIDVLNAGVVTTLPVPSADTT